MCEQLSCTLFLKIAAVFDMTMKPFFHAEGQEGSG